MIRCTHTLAVIFTMVSICRGELLPTEVAIVAVRGSRESTALANYYAKVRGIPEENICLIDTPPGEVLDREQWTSTVRPEIRRWINENDPEQQLRCLVTVWDVPLKIRKAPVDERLRRYQGYLQRERDARVKRLREIIAAFDQLAPDSLSSLDSVANELGISAEAEQSDTGHEQAAENNESELAALKKQLESALQAAQQRLTQLPDGDEQQQGRQEVERMATVSGGLRVMLQATGQLLSGGAANQQRAQTAFDQLRGQLTAYAESKAILDKMAPDIQRDALLLAVLERIGGLIVSVEWLDEQLAVVSKNETRASFDSELSLVMWPDDYQLLRWQPNYLRPEYDQSELRSVYRTLMVARIDAPTLVLAKGLIDTAIETEKNGLRGKAYFDARGIGNLDQPPAARGSYAEYDQLILISAKGIEDQSDMEVIVDENPTLFQADQCPDAALYCGWYSLAKYVDAFDWALGAVAYHLASAEAKTLRDAESQVWCKRMLEDGVCATIGPVYEPYLLAFPKPNEFFSLLLGGEMTLVEAYYRCKPFNSWMMTLIGDPLYQPFRGP